MTRASTVRIKLAAVPAARRAAPGTAQDDEEAAFDRTPQDCVRRPASTRPRGRRSEPHLPHAQRRRLSQPFAAQVSRAGAREPNRVQAREQPAFVQHRHDHGARGIRLRRFRPGFRNGFTCRLGEFVPLSPEEVEDLELRATRSGGRRTQSAIETSAVELDEADDRRRGRVRAGRATRRRRCPPADDEDD